MSSIARKAVLLNRHYLPRLYMRCPTERRPEQREPDRPPDRGDKHVASAVVSTYSDETLGEGGRFCDYNHSMVWYQSALAVHGSHPPEILVVESGKIQLMCTVGSHSTRSSVMMISG